MHCNRKTDVPYPSIDFLKEAIRLDELTGRLYWRERPRNHFLTEDQWKSFNKRKAGKPADSGIYPTKGYRRVRMKFLRRTLAISAHRVVFVIHHGHWPQFEIDHINRDRLDNRPANLRDVSHSENIRNRDPYTRQRRTARMLQPAQ